MCTFNRPIVRLCRTDRDTASHSAHFDAATISVVRADAHGNAHSDAAHHADRNSAAHTRSDGDRYAYADQRESSGWGGG